VARGASIAYLLSIAVAVAAGSAAEARNPLSRTSFYVDPASPAALQAKQWRRSGRAQDAAAMRMLARQPTAKWITGRSDDFKRVRTVTAAAAKAHKSALLVAYYIPQRGCGSQFASVGAPSASAYRRWVSRFARSIGRRAATVIVEPDAVPQAAAGCLSPPAAAARYQLLRFAVHTFSALRKTTVYLDAGNLDWVGPVANLVGPLELSGVREADGFALNVSNFYATDSTIGYGTSLSALLGGKHFVIDTSRNGNGPYTAGDGAPNWCDPPGRAIGHEPTTHTGVRLVDAFLWIKLPGESDGPCRPGAPDAGVWWPDYALGLVRNAA
jgi:endoglucanase